MGNHTSLSLFYSVMQLHLIIFDREIKHFYIYFKKNTQYFSTTFKLKKKKKKKYKVQPIELYWHFYISVYITHGI